MPTQEDVFQGDVRDLLSAVGLSDHARPKSPHRVVQDEVIPTARKQREALETIRDELQDVEQEYRTVNAANLQRIVDSALE